MRLLFAHQNFPGEYLHLIRRLLRDPAHQVVFVSEGNANTLPGVRRIIYQVPPYVGERTHPHAREFERACIRAEVVAARVRDVLRLGFNPDIIIGHHGWGEMLGLADICPGVPILGYFEFYYSPHGQDVNYDPEFPVHADQFPRIRAMNAVNHAALALDQHGQCPTRWQRSTYPDWAQPHIRLLPEGADLTACRPDAALRAAPLELDGITIAPGEKLVTYVARNLEPYRGFHVMMRAVPDILAARPDVKLVLVGGDGVSYGAALPGTTWRAHMLAELGTRFDPARVAMPGQVPYDIFRQLLARSDAHVYLTYPFVPSWSLREAMASGCAIVAADVDPVREFVTQRRTGLLVPGLDPKAVAGGVLELLEDTALAGRLRRAARRHAEAHLDLEMSIAGYGALISELTGIPLSLAAPQESTRRRRTARA